MQQRHPGGLDTTRRLLALSGLPPCRILDMGAGEGGAVGFLRSLGFEARGIDLAPGKGVRRGDFLRCPHGDGSFDAVLSECAFYASGDFAGALREAARLLRPGGVLLLSDVCFADEAAHRSALELAGFQVRLVEDATALWREYYIARIWDGTADVLCPRPEGGGKCRYYLTIGERK